MESFGWKNTFFSMRFPLNLPCESSDYFIDEIQFGHDYNLLQKISKATKVIYSFEAQRKLRALIQDRQPDVAHLHNIYHHLSPSILSVLKEAGIPAVMTAHDLKLACPNNKMLNARGICERCKGGRYHHAVLNRCVLDSTAASVIVALESTLHRWLDSYSRNLDLIIVPSRFFIDKFVEWGWQRDRFVHVPNFVDASAYEAVLQPGRYFVYFGRLASEKGLFTLVRAAARAQVPLVLVGTGPIETELKRLSQQLGAETTFTGYKTGADLHGIVRGARASVLPSECYENSPISVLESLALGKPVIGARIGGIPEMVRAGESGWLFDSGDADALARSLRSAWDSEDARLITLGRRGRHMVEAEFSRERYAESMLDIYTRLGVGAPGIEGASMMDHV